MPKIHPVALRLLKLAAAFILFAGPAGRLPAKFNWEPIPPADLQGKECTWYPGADAEALLLRLVLLGSDTYEMHGQYYKRIKIYSPKGVEDLGVLSIDRSDSQRVWEHGARVTKPDGTSKEYGKESFHETVEAKLGSTKITRLKLAVPNLDAGDIVEIKWKITMTSYTGWQYWWYAQLDIPVRLYTFSTEDIGRPYSTNWFNVKAQGQARKSRDGMDLVMTDLPPFKAEPAMPPERDVRGWFMIYFRSFYDRWNVEGQDFLKELSSYFATEFRDRTKPDATVKAKAKELLAGATADAEKLRRLYEFCQQRVENFDYQTTAALQAARKKLGDDLVQSPKQTLARGSGASSHVNDLFAALARASDYEVAEGRAASRHSTLAVKTENGWMFLQDQMILIKVAGKWQCFAPGDYLVPYGMVDYANLGVSALVCQKDKVEWLDVPVLPAAKSVTEREGRFTLDPDGTLEGEVEMVLTGYPAIARKGAARGKQQEEIDADFRETVTATLPSAEITDLAWENLTNIELPVRVRYKVRVPGYADAVGSRLVVPLNYFTHNQPVEFSAESRKFPITFRNAYTERDNVRITAPPGFSADAPSAPQDVGGNGGIGSTYRVSYKRIAREISYRRELVVCEDGGIGFHANSYPALKRRFDAIKLSDEHTLVFAESAPATPAATPAATPGAH